MTTPKSAKFWDRMARRYSQQPVADEAAYQKKLEVTQSYLHPDMEVLEFGCGTGSTAIVHAPFVKHILATDISARMIEIAQDRARAEAVPNVTFEQTTLESVGQSGRSWDAILGLNILHLQDSWSDVISQVYTLLKPGGVFISSTHCLGDNMKFISWIAPIGSYLGLMPSVVVFTTSQLETAMTKTGFAIEHQWHPGKGKAVFMVAKKPNSDSRE